MSWLIHRTGITRGAAVGHSAWACRAATHPKVVAALAAGSVSESVGRVICPWTGKLPQEHRDAGDEQLLAAFAAGLGLADLAGLFAEMYVRARGDLPDQDPGREFADREVKLATTLGGAGVMHGDLTAGCAAAVAAVLDALSAPAGKDDDRTKGQRYHDALAEAMRRLTAANLLPERAGQPVRAWAGITLADLLRLQGSSALQEQWDDAGPGPVGRPPRGRVRDRRERRRLAGRGRRRGHRLPLDIGYSETIPAGIRNAVTLRDRHCRFPGGCNQPASVCDVHHVKHKKHGGTTSTTDCVLLCFFHHQIVIRSSSTNGAGSSSSTRTAPPPRGTRTRPRSSTATDRPPGPGRSPGMPGASVSTGAARYREECRSPEVA